MKRVYCLYRVSTLGQVDKDDIPMQREACREFANEKGWRIVEEFSEKGVSGYKVATENREALQLLKKAATQKLFDVLLVFMFDRLGRRDDETPFVVEWFVKNGIEVWSVVEGEQRFEDHVDKLLNYIRYWQSSGESIKTSIRTRTRMEQLTREGFFTGGTVAYGYKLCKLGRTNKRGIEVHDIIINQSEAAIVKEIFSLYTKDGIGTYSIATYLNKKGLVNGLGKTWKHTSIQSILKNETYTGIIKFSNAQSNVLPRLIIIDRDTFEESKMLQEINSHITASRRNPAYKEKVLFGELVYCLCCGKKMTVTRSAKKHIKKNGEVKIYEKLSYICKNNSGNCPCGKSKRYSCKIIDPLLIGAILDILMKGYEEEFQVLFTKGLAEARAKKEDLEFTLSKEQQSLSLLKDEAVEVISGNSAFGSILISDFIRESELKILAYKNEIRRLSDTEKKQKNNINNINSMKTRLEYFPMLSINEQREILKEFIFRIYLAPEYKYRVEWTFGGYLENK